jgi:putative methyltransferase (TIGR04325 family)
VESFDDPRITFTNRLYRGPYPADPYTRWLVAGVPAYNEAVRRARGRWIAPLDDDDAFRPHHIERLLTRARSEQLELCYSPICHHRPDGSTEAPRHFPPEYGEFTLQSALYHAGLGEIFELELGDAALGLPYDWALCRRMMEADVRIGMVDEETVDYFPSRLWKPRWEESLPWGRISTKESPAPGPAPPTKVFTGVFEDARLLPHFLRHYAASGIREFYVAVPSGRENEIEHLASGYRVTISSTQIDDSDILAGQAEAIRQLRERRQGEDEWALIVDLDELVSFRESLESIIDAAEAEGANVVRGVVYDRFSADGRIVDFEPGSDLAARYPVRARFTRDVMLGCDYRAALVKGRLAGAPPAGQHGLAGEVVATKMLDIDRYTWTSGSIDRLRERRRALAESDVDSKAEYDRAIEHYEAHGRFAWEDFGGQLAQPEWEFVPEGWERAATIRSWDATEVARSYREKWPQFLDALEGPGPLGVSHEVPVGAPIERHDLLAQNSVLAYALALARARDGSRRLSVLDRGGALGHFYVLAKRLFPDLELDYHCRELPAVAAQGRDVLPEVTFHDTDDCFERTYDLVIASNSLQYEEDWRGLLRKLANASAHWTFLTRVPIVRQQASFVVLQRAYRYGYATEYLGWVLNRDELLGAATDAGLQLERELVLENQLEIDGAPAFTDAGFLFRAGG